MLSMDQACVRGGACGFAVSAPSGTLGGDRQPDILGSVEEVASLLLE